MAAIGAVLFTPIRTFASTSDPTCSYVVWANGYMKLDTFKQMVRLFPYIIAVAFLSVVAAAVMYLH
jgi:hypothetical protein